MLRSSVRAVALGLALLAEPCASQHLRGRAPELACALGENIRAVTDMGFDDWGAFSVLSAAGCTPQKALGVEGMMPPAFANNFSKLLKSWGLGTQVYRDLDLPEGTCFGNKKCIINETTRPSWLGEYRDGVYTSLPGATGRPWSEVEAWSDDVSNSTQDFWNCAAGEEYTLLVIGPHTAEAKQLTNTTDEVGRKTVKCIKEIVYMGGLFANAHLLQNDPATYGDAPLGPASSASTEASSSFSKPKSGSPITEINILSDIDAARDMWVNLPNGMEGLTQRIFSLETASFARAGLNKIQFENLTIDKETQISWDAEILNETMANVDCDSPKTMLAKMACLKDEDGHHSLDFDAIAATYLWLGNASVDVSWTHISVSINDDGVTMPRNEDNSLAGRVFLAQEFNAIAWLQRLGDMLDA